MCPPLCWEDLGIPNGPYLPGVPCLVGVKYGGTLRAGVAGPVLYSRQDKSNKGVPSFVRDRDWLGRHLQKSKI